MPVSTHQPETLVCSPAGTGGGWELRLGLRRSIPGRKLKGFSVTQLARRVSGKRSGAAEEARDFFLPLCFVVHEERGLRAPPKQAPEMAQATAINSDPRDRHEMLRLLLQTPRSLCASTGHYPHLPSQESVQPTTARVL